MKKNLLLLAFLLFSAFAKAQYNQVSCVDSTAIDIYHYCSGDYEPVCGCDGKTYRNTCAADYWGGLINAVTQPVPGICGDYDVDFVPNPIVPGSLSNSPGHLSIYTINQVTALIQIYDIFGRIWYTNQPTLYPSPPVYEVDIYFDNFPQGIYYLFVIINGESQKKKIVKANLF